MSHWQHGLVIGKFRPPHLGHGLLIETALSRVDQLTVLVCADAADTIPADLRAAWLGQLYPAAWIRVVETTGPDPDDSRLWAGLTRRWLGRAPDVVFTSESYGERYARELGCDHLAVDPAQARVPIAASQILAHPLAYLDFLAPPVHAYFIPRIALVGAESTGKTTLARALAAHYQTTWVPEYGRTFWEGLLTLPTITGRTVDFVHIVEVQRLMESRLAEHAAQTLICDTEALTTLLWHERYVGPSTPELERLVDVDRYALYILTGDEIPWQDDGQRDRADERPRFHRRFGEELRARAAIYTTVEGSPARRLAQATRAIDALLAPGRAAGPGLAE